MRIMSRHTGKPPSSAGHNGDIRRHGGGSHRVSQILYDPIGTGGSPG